MKKLLALLFLMSLSAHASLRGTPFLPESDSRFDALEGQSTVNATAGVHPKQLAVATWDYSIHGGSSTVGAISLGVALPNGALITRSYGFIESTLTAPAGPGAKFEVGCGSAANIIPLLDYQQYGSQAVIEGTATGASNVIQKVNANCNISATFTTNSVTAGKATAYVEYVLHP